MKIKDETCKKLNNKGFSLIEVLIAMAILAIVAIPISQSFITSAKYNAKARSSQQETGAAQSIMEGFKAFDVDSLEEQFTSTDTSKFRVYVTTGSSFQAYNSYSMDTRSAGDPYVFHINGMNYQDHQFDARITMTPYSNATYDGTKEIEYVDKLNGFRDAIYSEEPVAVSKGYRGIVDLVVNKANSVVGFYNTENGIMRWTSYYDRSNIQAEINSGKVKIKRNTEINVDNVSGNRKVTVKTTYTAILKGNFRDTLGRTYWIDNTSSPLASVYETKEVYNNTNTSSIGAELENVFILFYPVYNSNIYAYPIAEDNFVINNNLGGSNEVNVYLIKQKDEGYGSSLKTLENVYTPRIEAKNHVKLYHNFTENLGDKGSSVGHATIVCTNGSVATSELTHKEDEELLYNVVIDLYKQGESDIIYTMEGTKSDN